MSTFAPSVNVRRVAALLWSRRLTLGIFILVAALASALYALTRTVQYESNALLTQVKDDTSPLGGALSSVVGSIGSLAGGLGGLTGGGTTVEESVAVLRSRDFSLRFMREHGVLQFMYPELWDAAAQRWKVEPSTAGPSLGTRLAQWLSAHPTPYVPPPPGPSPDAAVRRFDDIRVADIDRRTNFVRLSVRGPTPQQAQAWASAMIAELNDWLRTRTLQDSRLAVEVLAKKVDSDPLQSSRTIAAALLEQQLRHEVAAESRREFAVRVLDPPSLPDQRYYPRRARMVVIGAGLGFLFGAAYIVALSAWRNRRRVATVASS